MAKTQFNNFDVSSTGLNLELSIYRCLSTAGVWWDDFVQDADGLSDRLIYRDNRGGVNFIVLCRDKDALFYPLDELEKMEQERLENLWDSYDVGLYTDISEMSVSELAAEIHAYVTVEAAYNLLAEVINWQSLPYDFIATGYSQGDAVKVLIHDDGEGESIDWYESRKNIFTRQHIENLLYDVPIQGNLIVNGLEFYLDEMDLDPYETDKDKIIDTLYTEVKDNTQLTTAELHQIEKWLQTNVPDYIDHV